MNDFLKKAFQSYYLKPEISFPERFPRREYAFIFWGERQMVRHVSFKRREELLSILRRRVPMHAYYSSAYYEKPDAPTMPEKTGWVQTSYLIWMQTIFRERKKWATRKCSVQ